ncbi:MAG TPA: GAF domain-containing protein [Gaiellaceae bacterium]|nr:GAF domain-containing protein [Gaiellaceae bacterium]
MAVAARLRLLDALGASASSLVETLDADACAISRALGDALLFVTEHVRAGVSLQLGQGYLASEFPATQEVLESRRPRALCLADPHVDQAEARLLRELGHASLLMLPLDVGGEPWGLVEVYRVEPREFGPVEIRAAGAVLAELSR